MIINEIAWIDIEATGVDPENDRIIELCVVVTDMALNQLYPSATMLFNPERGIPAEASEVHGIYDHHVKNQPTFKDESETIKAIIEPRHIGTFNGLRYDIPLLIAEMHRAGIYVNLNSKDRLLPDAYSVFTKKEPRDLENAVSFYTGTQLEGGHRAEADVLATIKVAKAQMERYNIPDLWEYNNVSEPENRFDIARKIVMSNGVPIFNFGKHYGEPISEHSSYLEWMLGNNFPIETKIKIKKYLEWTSKETEKQV